MKLAAIAVVFAIPLTTTTWFLLQEKAIKIDFARHELQGDEYLRPADLPRGVLLRYADEPDMARLGRLKGF